jgi:hypothetical protein
MHSRSAARCFCEAEPKILAAREIHPVSGITADRSVFPHEVIGTRTSLPRADPSSIGGGVNVEEALAQDEDLVTA